MKEFGIMCTIIITLGILFFAICNIVWYQSSISLKPEQWSCTKEELIWKGPPAQYRCVQYSRKAK